MHFQRGVTLVETILYIAFIALLIPGFALTLGQIQKNNKVSHESIIVDQTSRLIFLELQDELSHATVFDSANSSFGVDFGKLQYIDKDGTEKTIELVQDVYGQGDEQQLIGRMRLTTPTQGSEWITSNTINITRFKIQPVKKSSVLSGVRLDLEIKPINSQTLQEEASATTLQTMFELASYAQEI